MRRLDIARGDAGGTGTTNIPNPALTSGISSSFLSGIQKISGKGKAPACFMRSMTATFI
jgi:hypothetical protein